MTLILPLQPFLKVDAMAVPQKQMFNLASFNKYSSETIVANLQL
jgi:hypothetical protein